MDPVSLSQGTQQRLVLWTAASAGRAGQPREVLNQSTGSPTSCCDSHHIRDGSESAAQFRTTLGCSSPRTELALKHSTGDPRASYLQASPGGRGPQRTAVPAIQKDDGVIWVGVVLLWVGRLTLATQMGGTCDGCLCQGTSHSPVPPQLSPCQDAPFARNLTVDSGV